MELTLRGHDFLSHSVDVYVRGDRLLTSLYHYLSNVLSLSQTLTKTCYKLCVTGVIRLTVTFVSNLLV